MQQKWTDEWHSWVIFKETPTQRQHLFPIHFSRPQAVFFFPISSLLRKMKQIQMAAMTLLNWFIKRIKNSFYSLSSSPSHSEQLRSWVMCCTAELKYFACFPWNMLKDAVDRTWHSKCLLSLPKMWCIISLFQHKELKRERKEKGKELHIVTYHPGWKIILFLVHFEAFTLDIQSSLCGGEEGRKPNINLLTDCSVFGGIVPRSC